MATSKVPKIKPVENYSTMPELEIVKRASAVHAALDGNANFTNLPVSLTDLKTQIDLVSALMAQTVDGSKKVVAEKNKQLQELIRMLRALGRHVELNCKDDIATFTSSGFEVAPTTRTPQAALSEKIRSVSHGNVSGQIVVKLKAVPQAGSYELRYGVPAGGALPTTWTTKSTTNVKPPITLDSLTPGTLYAFQARALVDTQFTDWSDPVTFMCT